MINQRDIKFIFSSAILSTLLVFFSPVIAYSESVSPRLVKFEENCNHGLHKQPNGPMAIINFCEDALGTHIALVYYDPMGAPVPIKFHNELSKKERETYYKVWSLDNRMWQEPLWSFDVTSYAWGPNGRKLYVSTSNIYGSGALYELDLIRRKYKQIAPEGKQHSISDPGPGLLITGISPEALVYQLYPGDLPEGADIKETKYKIE
jgi:hypothetical protein